LYVLEWRMWWRNCFGWCTIYKPGSK